MYLFFFFFIGLGFSLIKSITSLIAISMFVKVRHSNSPEGVFENYKWWITESVEKWTKDRDNEYYDKEKVQLYIVLHPLLSHDYYFELLHIFLFLIFFVNAMRLVLQNFVLSCFYLLFHMRRLWID